MYVNYRTDMRLLLSLDRAITPHLRAGNASVEPQCKSMKNPIKQGFVNLSICVEGPDEGHEQELRHAAGPSARYTFIVKQEQRETERERERERLNVIFIF